MMLTSFLVIAGTGKPYLIHALGSLVAQNTDEWEAIVVEACANERDTERVLTQIEAVNDPRVRLVSYDGDRRYPPWASRKWNFALRIAKGTLVAFLDDDDMKEQNWLSAMSSPFQSRPDLMATICNGSTISHDDNPLSRVVILGQLFGQVSLDYETLLKGNFVTCGQIMVRREVFDNIGYFDEELGCSEDFDFCLRLAKCQSHFVDSTKCLKRADGPDSANKHPEVGRYTALALRKIAAKHEGLRWLANTYG